MVPATPPTVAGSRHLQIDLTEEAALALWSALKAANIIALLGTQRIHAALESLAEKSADQDNRGPVSPGTIALFKNQLDIAMAVLLNGRAPKRDRHRRPLLFVLGLLDNLTAWLDPAAYQ